MKEDIQEVPRHQKKKESNTSKSRAKSDHKHLYCDCLFITEEGKPYKGKYCTVCGKVHDVELYSVNKFNGYYVAFTENELYEKYSELPKLKISSIFNKYISVDM